MTQGRPARLVLLLLLLSVLVAFALAVQLEPEEQEGSDGSGDVLEFDMSDDTFFESIKLTVETGENDPETGDPLGVVLEMRIPKTHIATFKEDIPRAVRQHLSELADEEGFISIQFDQDDPDRLLRFHIDKLMISDSVQEMTNNVVPVPKPPREPPPADAIFALHAFSFQPKRISTDTSKSVVFEVELFARAGLLRSPFDKENGQNVKEYTPSQICLLDPTGQRHYLWLQPENTLISGDDVEGTYRCIFPVVPHTTPGDWTVAYILLRDANEVQFEFNTGLLQTRGFDISFTVILSAGDLDPPELTNIEIVDYIINVSEGQPLSVNTWIRDDFSGLSRTTDQFVPFCHMLLESVNGRIKEDAVHFLDPVANLKQGSLVEGLFEWQIHLPIWIWSGEWKIVGIFLSDEAGHFSEYGETEFSRLMFNSHFYVNSSFDGFVTYVSDEL